MFCIRWIQFQDYSIIFRPLSKLWFGKCKVEPLLPHCWIYAKWISHFFIHSNAPMISNPILFEFAWGIYSIWYTASISVLFKIRSFRGKCCKQVKKFEKTKCNEHGVNWQAFQLDFKMKYLGEVMIDSKVACRFLEFSQKIGKSNGLL